MTAEQFFGMDINPFAIEFAKVTMMIARKLAIDELHTVEPALPLDNLDRNFLALDALIDPQGNPTVWPQGRRDYRQSAIPRRETAKARTRPDYVNAVRRAYPEVPGMADYCVYWFRKTHDALPRVYRADDRRRPCRISRHAERP